jgi:hypothetical protein
LLQRDKPISRRLSQVVDFIDLAGLLKNRASNREIKKNKAFGCAQG